MATEEALRMCMGMVFHFKGAATEKALSPAHLLLLGTLRLRPWSVRVLSEPSAWSFNSKACINVPGTEYIQWLVDLQEKVLKLMRSLMRNQWSFFKRGLMLARLGGLKTSRAHLFWRRCKRICQLMVWQSLVMCRSIFICWSKTTPKLRTVDDWGMISSTIWKLTSCKTRCVL